MVTPTFNVTKQFLTPIKKILFSLLNLLRFGSKNKSIIQPYGKILFNEDYHRKICEPAVSSLIGIIMGDK